MKPLVGIVAVVVLAFGVACSSPGGDAAAAGGSAADAPFEISDEPVATTDVDLPKSYKFDPVAISIDAGDEVTWTNNDDFPHNVHLLDGSDVTEDLPMGESATITFDEAGEIYYECSIHPSQMKGLIVVN
ncbi:MAG: cupredoxin domain-containing protein [Actinomycetota bacterium]